jgi:hypothetical protein
VWKTFGKKFPKIDTGAGGSRVTYTSSPTGGRVMNFAAWSHL